MDSSRQTDASIDELRRIELEARQSRSLDDLRAFFDRVQLLRRSHPNDFDLQLFVAEVQERIIERGRFLRSEPASVLLSDNPSRLITDELQPSPFDEASSDDNSAGYPRETPAGVERLDEKTWQRATYIGLFFTVIVLAAFFYLIQTARRLNFPPAETAAAPAAGTTAPVDAKKGAVQPVVQQASVSTKPTVRLYTDLVPGTVSVDGNPPEDLKDGELQFDNLEPGRHSIKVIGRAGDAAFSYDVEEKKAPKIVGLPSANNVMAVLVSSQDGKARLVTNADQSEVSLDGKPAGQVGIDGLTLEELGTSDHDLQVTQGKDRQRFVLTYTAAPALTAYVKSDPIAGTAVVVTGQDGAEVYINDKLYRRKTDRGQIRVPNLKVGEYAVRVHKQGFIDPPPQTIAVKKSEETRVEFHLQPVPEIATLQIKGALPGTMVYVDHDLAAAIGADGNASISNVKPGDHVIELRRDQALTKRFQRRFNTGDVVALTGLDVTLDKVVAENKPAPVPVAPPAPTPVAAADNNSMQVEGEQVRKGGGFVHYHATRVPGRYSFQAQVRKGGFLKKGKLQWYAAYQDPQNYVLFTLDGKRATIREVENGTSAERKVPFSSDSNEWVQVEMAVKQNSIDARIKTPGGGWDDLGPVSGSRDFTQGKVGFLIPGSDEIAVSNFRFSAR